MLVSVNASRSTDLRNFLYKWACRYSPSEACCRRIVERTIASAAFDIDQFSEKPIPTGLRCLHTRSRLRRLALQLTIRQQLPMSFPSPAVDT